MTASEFERLPDDCRFDLIEGELRPMPPLPGEEHGFVTNLFAVHAGAYVIHNNLGACYAAETRFIIEHNPDSAIGPDWSFIRADRMPESRSKGFVPIVPDAVLEVRSPFDRSSELQEKLDRWIAAGVQIAWDLDPARRTVRVLRADGSTVTIGEHEMLSGEDVLPGFEIALKAVLDG